MKNIYKVSWKHSEYIYCSNIAIASNESKVKEHYADKDCLLVSNGYEYDVESAKRKGMPIINLN